MMNPLDDESYLGFQCRDFLFNYHSCITEHRYIPSFSLRLDHRSEVRLTLLVDDVGYLIASPWTLCIS